MKNYRVVFDGMLMHEKPLMEVKMMQISRCYDVDALVNQRISAHRASRYL